MEVKIGDLGLAELNEFSLIEGKNNLCYDQCGTPNY
jgi:hypothetical protein